MIPSALRSSPGFPKELASLSPSVSPNNAKPPAHLKTAASFTNSGSLSFFTSNPSLERRSRSVSVPPLGTVVSVEPHRPPSRPPSLPRGSPARVPPPWLSTETAAAAAAARESRSDSPLGWMWLVRMVPASRTCHSPVPTRALAPSCSHRAIPRQEARGRQEDGTRPGPEEAGEGSGREPSVPAGVRPALPPARTQGTSGPLSTQARRGLPARPICGSWPDGPAAGARRASCGEARASGGEGGSLRQPALESPRRPAA